MINNKRILIGFLSVIVLTIMMCSLVSAFALTSWYHNLNYLKLEPGETKEVVFGAFQNSGDVNVTLDIKLVEGNEIAELTDKNLDSFIIPAGELNVPLHVKVSIPEDAIEDGEQNITYKISIRYQEIKILGDGMITIIESKTSSIPVLVEKSEEEPIIDDYSCKQQILDLKPGKHKSSKYNPGLRNVFDRKIGWARD